jgi:hypothetical protein
MQPIYFNTRAKQFRELVLVTSNISFALRKVNLFSSLMSKSVAAGASNTQQTLVIIIKFVCSAGDRDGYTQHLYATQQL